MSRPKLPEDPLIHLEQGLLRANRRLGILVNAWIQARLRETVAVRKQLGLSLPVSEETVEMIKDRIAVNSDEIIGDTFSAAAGAKLFAEYRQTIVEIHKIRIAKDKQRLEERRIAAKLPPVDDAAINAEIDRLITERLALMDGRTMLELAHAKISEERLLREAEEPQIGDPVPSGDAD